MTNSKLALAMVLVIAAALFVAPVAAKDKVGHLRVKIDPWNAGVYVNGVYKGTAAMYGHKSKELPLPPGQYEVKFVDPRFEPLVVPIEIDAGKTTTIRRSMQSLNARVEGPFGELETQGFSNAAVYLNGRYYGNTKEFGTPGEQLLVKAGTYDLKIVPVSGGAPRKQKITINADETLIINRTGAIIRRR